MVHICMSWWRQAFRSEAETQPENKKALSINMFRVSLQVHLLQNVVQLDQC